MLSKNDVLAKMKELKGEIQVKYKVKSIGLFGSFVRDEQNETSDIDVLVEFESPIGFFKFLELEEFLGHQLGCKVELVSKKALKPRIGSHILREVLAI